MKLAPKFNHACGKDQLILITGAGGFIRGEPFEPRGWSSFRSGPTAPTPRRTPASHRGQSLRRRRNPTVLGE